LSTTTPLAEQQRLLRQALDKLTSQPSNLINRTSADALRYAIADHDDPDTGCRADPGTECVAVKLARRVLTAQL
jgi:hypothetical protein